MKVERWSWRLLLVVFSGVLLLVGGPALAKNPDNVVHVFGDSLSDPGNLYALTGFFPPSPPYAQRNSNGPVWAEYLAEDLGVVVDNRAVGGAFTGVYLIGGVSVSNFNNVQYDFFPFLLPGVAEEIDSLLEDYPGRLNPDALYVVWAGPNDFFLGLGQPGGLEIVLPQAIANISEDVCRLGTAGARHFMVGNMPDIGLTPFIRDLGPETQAAISYTIAQYNLALEATLDQLPQACAETIEVFDAYEALHTLVEAPGEFGFSNVTDACLNGSIPDDFTVCPNPDEYLFWDGVHPTTRTHEIFAGMIRAEFCETENGHPGLRGPADELPPPAWRGVCFGTK